MRRRPKREWETSAACFGHDEEPEVIALLDDLAVSARKHKIEPPLAVSELFFPPRVKSLYHVWANEAKAYCDGPDGRHPCPVRKECLLWAIDTEEEHGIFGGMSHRERNALVRKAASKNIPIEEYIDRAET